MSDRLRDLWRSASTVDKDNYFEFVIEKLIPHACKSAACVIDAGANYGAHTLTMLHTVSAETPVFAFEPNPHLAVVLEKWRELHPNLEVRRIALSDRAGDAEFLIASDAGYGSLYSRPHFGVAVSDRVNVTTARLDDFPEFRMTSPVGFIKADIEGSEIAFLHGARETLLKARPIVVMELDWGFTLPTPGDTESKLFGYLGSIGYSV
ncbi:MAG: FkbM family methyltransferase, partial [Acetobacteraceae bacterium]